MGKKNIFMLILGALATMFFVADIVLLCIFQGNVFAAGLTFFLFLMGFGLSMMAMCLLWLLGKKEETQTCPECGEECATKYAFCPACGAKLSVH